MFFPGKEQNEPANFGKGKSLRFSIRGDGRKYSLQIYTVRRGPVPAIKQEFVAGKDWSEHVVSLHGDVGADITGIWFGSRQPGQFELRLDEVRVE
jgi:hypothetical protein